MSLGNHEFVMHVERCANCQKLEATDMDRNIVAELQNECFTEAIADQADEAEWDYVNRRDL